ncbi:MAG: hypothetical protein Q7J27_04570 [Syntrophales bacterium]|nr:hypothetical protein [Syntrophales bacterium]
MHDLRTVDIPKITDPTVFENLCRDLWKNDSANDPVCFNGRPGQAQDGVDVYGRNTLTGEWFGLQCKVRAENNTLSKNEIDAEIAKARNFNPSLRRYYLCTTLKRDAVLQEIERTITDELATENRTLSFQIVFWNDIEEKLKEESNINIYCRYYHQYFVDNTTIGHSIGKLINLELGTPNSMDTHYELVIGKFPHLKDAEGTNVNYYRGTYFIINFHERKIETFHSRCFASDIEAAFVGSTALE